jgi:hypothetical protein
MKLQNPQECKVKKQTNQPSTRSKIIDAITAAKEINLAGLRKVFPNTKVSRISVVLWQLKKAGVITHNLKTGFYSLTPVNKTEEPVEQPKAQPKVAPAVTERQLHIAQRDAKYWKELAEERHELATKLNVKYEDALAIVRYLEEKLFKAVQFNTRNGRNS